MTRPPIVRITAALVAIGVLAIAVFAAFYILGALAAVVVFAALGVGLIAAVAYGAAKISHRHAGHGEDRRLEHDRRPAGDPRG